MELQSPINNTRGRPGTSGSSTNDGSIGLAGAFAPAAGSRFWPKPTDVFRLKIKARRQSEERFMREIMRQPSPTVNGRVAAGKSQRDYARAAFPPADRFARFISEYLREKSPPPAPALSPAAVAAKTSSGEVFFWPASVGTSMSMPG